jgi:hypothetical protein
LNVSFRATAAAGLMSIDAPDTATIGKGTHANAYGVDGPFANPPSGGKFIQAEGNPDDESSFGQPITGLPAFTTYDLSVWQAGIRRPRRSLRRLRSSS